MRYDKRKTSCDICELMGIKATIDLHQRFAYCNSFPLLHLLCDKINLMSSFILLIFASLQFYLILISTIHENVPTAKTNQLKKIQLSKNFVNISFNIDTVPVQFFL